MIIIIIISFDAIVIHHDYHEESWSGAMHNWHRALCSTSEEAEWGGEFDPAYQPQQVIGDGDVGDVIIVIISMIVMIEISKEGESWSSLYYWLTNDNVDVWMIIKEAEQILYDIFHGDGSLLHAIVD